MPERVNQNMCGLEFDPRVVRVRPSGAEERVAINLIMLHGVSLNDLVRVTGLTDEQVLSEIKTLRKDYDVRGNKRTGYKLSPDPLKRAALNDHIEELSESRVVRE